MSATFTDAVLITGASSGIGFELAREFARHGHNLVIVAPVAKELHAVASALGAEYAVKAKPIAADLREADAVDHVVAELESLESTIGILVNNAGFGRLGRFWEVPLEEQIAMIRLNVEAGVRLVARILPGMLARGCGRIMNTASIAAFQPGPNLSVYHASKAFVLSWSESLATELEPAGITVTALCPGPVDTDFMTKAHMIDTHAFQDEKVMSPQAVAAAAYEGLMAGRRLVVPGAMNKALVFGRRFMPESMQARMSEKLHGPTDPAGRKRERGDIEGVAAREQEGRDEG